MTANIANRIRCTVVSVIDAAVRNVNINYIAVSVHTTFGMKTRWSGVVSSTIASTAWFQQPR
jgi:hypothetical protein